MNEIRARIESDLAAAKTPADIEAIRTRYLGRKGVITTLGKTTNFGALSAEERKSFGTRFNELRAFAEGAIGCAVQAIMGSQPTSRRRSVDLTLPAIDRRLGSLHPITLVQTELEDIFHGMGFMVLSGYEVESEYYNFDALNIPADHPAREMQDTYWLKNGKKGLLLRTHTSANQVRTLERYGAPVAAIFPGRCYRYESTDAKHENTFYQLEGLMVDQGISVANLIAVMKTLLARIFEREVEVRLRPGFFPFVEPGFELDLQCMLCGGKRCPTCRTGWIELIPCGLVHPRVLEYGGVSPEKYSGFAFGLGLTRLAMMKFGIPDIRLFNSGDMRFYDQFPATT